MSQIILDYAIEFAGRGIPVFPLHFPVVTKNDKACSCGKPDCKDAAKHPVGCLVPNGLKDATTNQGRIESWFTNQFWNLGLATGKESGVFALDCDPRHGGDKSVAALEVEHGPFPPTWIFQTGGGGQHILFRHPGELIPNSVSQLAAGIDVRGEGGYIVGPSSRHISGGLYLIAPESGLEPAEAPQWLLSRLLLPAQANQSAQTTQSPPSGFTNLKRRTEAEQMKVWAAILHIPCDNRDVWLRVGMALHSTGWGGSERIIWDYWSRTSSKFDAADQEKTWQSFGRTRSAGRLVSLGTLFRLAQANGWRGQSSHRLIAHRAGILLARGVDALACLDRMVEFNAKHCEPPLSEDEVLGIVGTLAQREIEKRAAIAGGRRNV